MVLDRVPPTVPGRVATSALQRKPPPPAIVSTHRSRQLAQKRLCDERLFEDALGFPRYIGPLGSYTLLVKLWEVMAVWSAPMAHRDSAQTMGHSQPMAMRLGGGSGSGHGNGNGNGSGTGVGDDDGTLGHGIELPPREVADVLVGLFFDKVHCDCPIFHRALFQASYEAMWRRPAGGRPGHGRHAPASENPPDTEPAWLMCLSMVFVLGLEAASAQSSAIRRLVGSTARREVLKARYLATAKAVLPDVIAGSMLVHVQALMLYCRYLHLTRSRNACWNLTGAAVRVAVAIGLHRNGVHGNCSPLERELRRRIWWTLYAFERIECSSLGRTSAIDDADCNVGVPTEGLLDMSDVLPLGYVGAHAELMMLLGSIGKHQYGGSGGSGGSWPPVSGQPPPSVDSAVDFALATSDALDQWQAALPGHLRLADNAPVSPASHQRAILLLHVQYHYTVTLLCRPFLLSLVGKAPSASSSASSSASFAPASLTAPSSATSSSAAYARKCIDAAKAAVAVLDQLFRAGLFNSKTWWDVYFIEATCMVLALGRFVHDRALRNDAGILDALRTCIHILKECKEFSPTMQRFAVVTTDFAQVLVREDEKGGRGRGGEEQGKAPAGEEVPPQNEQHEQNEQNEQQNQQPRQPRQQKQQFLQQQQQQAPQQTPQQTHPPQDAAAHEARPMQGQPSHRPQQQLHHQQHLHHNQLSGQPQPQTAMLFADVYNDGRSLHQVHELVDETASHNAVPGGGSPNTGSQSGSQSGSSPERSPSFAVGAMGGMHPDAAGGVVHDGFAMGENLGSLGGLGGLGTLGSLGSLGNFGLGFSGLGGLGNLAELAPFWGDWAEQEHWWQNA